MPHPEKPLPGLAIVLYNITSAAVDAPRRAVIDRYNLNLAEVVRARSAPPGIEVHL
jgi:hypothetical protein